VPVTVRDTRGREIDGACGQLAASVLPSASPPASAAPPASALPSDSPPASGRPS
jgi:23S rRNA (adenine2503-C2)-methyltransferase